MAKPLLTIAAECIAVNTRKAGQTRAGNVLFAIGAKDGDDGQARAKKVLNYQTTDAAELKSFEVGSTYTITITS